MARVAGCEPTATFLGRARLGLERGAILDAFVIDRTDRVGVCRARRAHEILADHHGLRL
jgi:bifunctional DNA-binding transcriptional regulator/antitoxin component of YhaV-PrlF toxin-antitoxin module